MRGFDLSILKYYNLPPLLQQSAHIGPTPWEIPHSPPQPPHTLHLTVLFKRVKNLLNIIKFPFQYYCGKFFHKFIVPYYISMSIYSLYNFIVYCNKPLIYNEYSNFPNHSIFNFILYALKKVSRLSQQSSKPIRFLMHKMTFHPKASTIKDLTKQDQAYLQL